MGYDSHRASVLAKIASAVAILATPFLLTIDLQACDDGEAS
jgi:hypothetical protein